MVKEAMNQAKGIRQNNCYQKKISLATQLKQKEIELYQNQIT